MTTIREKTSFNDKPSNLIITSVNAFIMHYNEAAWCLHEHLLFFTLIYLSVSHSTWAGLEMSSHLKTHVVPGPCLRDRYSSDILFCLIFTCNKRNLQLC